MSRPRTNTNKNMTDEAVVACWATRVRNALSDIVTAKRLDGDWMMLAEDIGRLENAVKIFIVAIRKTEVTKDV